MPVSSAVPDGAMPTQKGSRDAAASESRTAPTVSPTAAAPTQVVPHPPPGPADAEGPPRKQFKQRAVPCNAPDADVFYPKAIKKVPKGSVFCIKGENVRVLMTERLFEAFTLPRHLQSTFARGRGPTFPKAKRFHTAKKGAPVHSYSPDVGAAPRGSGVQRAQFCREQRFGCSKGAGTPGVGQYDCDHLTSINPYRLRQGRFAYAERGQHPQVQKVVEKPGPGEYDVVEPRTPPPRGRCTPCWGSERAERFASSRTLSPGPGAYEARPLRSKFLGIPKAPCRGGAQTCSYTNLLRESNSSGPGEYKMQSIFSPKARPCVARKWVAQGSVK